MSEQLQTLATSIQLFEYNRYFPLRWSNEIHALLCALSDSCELYNLVADFRNKFHSAIWPSLPCEMDLFFVLLLRYVISCKPAVVDKEQLERLRNTWSRLNDGETSDTIDPQVRRCLLEVASGDSFVKTLRSKGADPYKRFLDQYFPRQKRPEQLLVLEEMMPPGQAPTTEYPVQYSVEFSSVAPDDYLRELLEAVAEDRNMLSVLLFSTSPFLTHAENFLIQMLHALLWLRRSSCPLAHNAKASYCDLRNAMRGDSDAQKKVEESEALVLARARDMIPSFTEVSTMISAVRDPDFRASQPALSGGLEPARVRVSIDQASRLMNYLVKGHFNKLYLELRRQASWHPSVEERLYEAAKDSFIQNGALGWFRWLHHNYYIDHDCTVDKVVVKVMCTTFGLQESHKVTLKEEQPSNPLMKFIEENQPFTPGQLNHLQLLKSCFFPEPFRRAGKNVKELKRLGPVHADHSELNKLATAMVEPGNMLRALVAADSPILTHKEKVTMAVLHARLWLLRSDLPVYYGGKLTYRHLYDAFKGDGGATEMIEKYKAEVLKRATDPLPSGKEFALMFDTLRAHEKLAKPGDFIYHIKEEDLHQSAELSILGEPYLVKREEADTFRKSHSFRAATSDYSYGDEYLHSCVNKEPPRTFLRMKPPPEDIPYVIPIQLYYGHFARTAKC